MAVSWVIAGPDDGGAGMGVADSLAVAGGLVRLGL